MGEEAGVGLPSVEGVGDFVYLIERVNANNGNDKTTKDHQTITWF